jgi:hypothetical protein
VIDLPSRLIVYLLRHKYPPPSWPIKRIGNIISFG